MLKKVLFIIAFLTIGIMQMQATAKSVAALYLADGEIILDGKIDEPIWKQAESVSDFVIHKSSEVADGKVEAKTFNDGKFLYVAVKSFEKTADICSSANTNNLWEGDVVELFFGSLIPDNDYRYQVAANPASGKFASDNDLMSWDTASAIGENFWSVEFKIPLAKLKFNNLTTKFNIGCYKKKEDKQFVWSPVGGHYKGIKRFGNLILGDYNSALAAEFSLFFDRKIFRAEYEKISLQHAKTDWQIKYGPYLHALDKDKITVSWKTYGQTKGRVRYREQGKKNFITVKSNLQSGAAAENYFRHHTQLTGLAAGKTYEYQVQTFDYKKEEWCDYPSDKLLSFTIPEAGKKEFSFVVFTDFHSFGNILKKFMDLPQSRAADFAVNLGDMIDYADFQEDFYTCVVAPQQEFAEKKPIFNIRGNHETYGYAPISFFEVFPHHSGKSYYSFTYGDIFFIALDCGDTRYSPEMSELYKEQNLYLKKLVETEEFKNATARVILCHMPLIAPTQKYTQKMNLILQDVFLGENPIASIDLIIGGHTHTATITPANSDKAIVCGETDQFIDSVKLPFPVICNDGPGNMGEMFSMIQVLKSEQVLKINVINQKGKVRASHEVPIKKK